MKFRSIIFHKRANSAKLRITAKVWKAKIKLPCGFCLKEDVAHFESVRWIIYQGLN